MKGYMKTTPTKKLEEDFENDVPFILSGLQEREKELEEKKEEGQISCNFDDEEPCESCSG